MKNLYLPQEDKNMRHADLKKKKILEMLLSYIS